MLPGPNLPDALQLKVKAFVWFLCLHSTEWWFMFLCGLSRWKEPNVFIWTKVLTLTSQWHLAFSSQDCNYSGNFKRVLFFITMTTMISFIDCSFQNKVLKPLLHKGKTQLKQTHHEIKIHQMKYGKYNWFDKYLTPNTVKVDKQEKK